MPCYRPLSGWKSKQLTANGKRAVVFNPADGFVDLPVQVPCGQCIGCRLEKARQWAVRLVHESQSHVYRWFVTLTYDDDHLPAGGSLNKAHFQGFMKRLRKRTGANIRYMHCGEYGDTTFRPHYHAIIFGVDFPDRKRYSESPRGDPQWTSALLDEIWGMGSCIIGTFTYDSAGYVARYVLKKVTGDEAENFYRRVDEATGEVYDLVRPYVTMSLKPAIGQEFYEKFGEEISAKDEVVVRGVASLPPKRYCVLHEQADPDGAKRVKLKRRKQMASRKAENTPERLAVREEVKLSQLRSLKRS